jgi:hypothetical protein
MYRIGIVWRVLPRALFKYTLNVLAPEPRGKVCEIVTDYHGVGRLIGCGRILQRRRRVTAGLLCGVPIADKISLPLLMATWRAVRSAGDS